MTIVVLAAAAFAPHVFDGRFLESQLSTQLHVITGFSIETRIRPRFDLLPRPHVVAHEIEIVDPAGALRLEAPDLVGDVRLLPLLVGRVELTSVSFVKPRLTVDLDGVPMPADTTIGRAARDPAADQGNADQRLGAVSLVDGTVTVHSARLARPLVLDKVDATIDWPDIGSPATLTGSIVARQTPVDVAAWVAQPASLLRGDRSAMTLSLHSAPLDVSANGELTRSRTTSFQGRVALSALSGADLLALAEVPGRPPARFANLTLSSDATLTVDPDGQPAVDLPNLRLRVDDNDYEGTLAVQAGARPSVSGTLACEHLSLAPFLRTLPPVLDAHGGWGTTMIDASRGQSVDLDLRISATHLRLAAFSVEDAALAVMTRDDRTEVGLIEGRAYGGAIKGRVSFGLGDGGLSLRGVGSLTDVDAATLSWDAFGRQLATGRLSGSLSLEASGDSSAALVDTLSGSVRAEMHDGELSTIDIDRTLSSPSPTSGALVDGRTPFGTMALAVRLSDGIATIDKGTISSAAVPLDLGGTVDLRDRRVDVVVTATAQPAAARSLDLSGPLGHVRATPAEAAGRQGR